MQSKIQVDKDIYKTYKKEYNVYIKIAKANYIQHIITNSNNTSKVLWKFVNRGRGSPNNKLTCNIHLQEGNGIVLSPSRICNIFDKTFTEMVNKLVVGKNLMHPQINNIIISINDSLVLLEITETDLSKVI